MKKFTTPSRKDVRQMFDQISSRYDRTNRIISLGRDLSWRKKVAGFVPKARQMSYLDLATGTGDQLFAVLAKHKERFITAKGIDLSEKMLQIARSKLSGLSLDQNNISFAQGDAQRIPFADHSFDFLTMSFGIRNVMNLSTCFQDMIRVLKQNGRAVILEFAMPKQPLKAVYLIYLRRLLPIAGKFLTKHHQAYRYLNETIETFPYGDQFCQLMQQAGFRKVRKHSLMMGTVNLYVADK